MRALPGTPAGVAGRGGRGGSRAVDNPQPPQTVCTGSNSRRSSGDLGGLRGLQKSESGAVSGAEGREGEVAFTHMLLPAKSFVRSLRQLLVLAAGRPLVDPRWLEDCHTQGKLVCYGLSVFVHVHNREGVGFVGEVMS